MIALVETGSIIKTVLTIKSDKEGGYIFGNYFQCVHAFLTVQAAGLRQRGVEFGICSFCF